MRSTLPYFIALVTFITGCLAAPTTTPFSYENITMTFTGGPASYTLTFPADGSYHPTGNALSISTVDAHGFNAFVFCNFYTGTGTLDYLGVVNTGAGNVALGPPKPVTGVACAPTGASNQCLPQYATCEWNGVQGTILLPCCSGICAATKCRVY